MKLTAFCVLLVFSCLVTNVENATWQDHFNGDNLKKALKTVAKSFQEAGAKVSEALSSDNIQKAFNSLIQSPQNTPSKKESKKKSNPSKQPVQNSTSNTTLAPAVVDLGGNVISLVKTLKNTDASSADVINGVDLVENSNFLTEIPTDAVSSVAETEDLKKNSSSLADALKSSIGSIAEGLKNSTNSSNSLPSAADNITSENLNENSSSLAEILKDAGSNITQAIDDENLQKNLNRLADVLQNTSISISEAVGGDNLKKNSNSLGEVLTDADSNIARDFSSVNLTNIINSVTDSRNSNDCIMEIVKTILDISKEFFVELQACTDYARVEHVGKATAELIIIGKELQSTYREQCSDQTKCLEKFAMGIAKLIKQSNLIREDVEHLKLDRGLCALATLAGFAETMPIANLREKCSI
ncbi:uncharacterized protein ACN427_008850 [Glossina fuscipes fuscipes]